MLVVERFYIHQESIDGGPNVQTTEVALLQKNQEKYHVRDTDCIVVMYMPMHCLNCMNLINRILIQADHLKSKLETCHHCRHQSYKTW